MSQEYSDSIKQLKKVLENYFRLIIEKAILDYLKWYKEVEECLKNH